MARKFVLARFDTDNGKAPPAKLFHVDANRAYLLFFDYRARETHRMIDPQRRLLPERWTIDTVSEQMERIAGTRPIGRTRGRLLAHLVHSKDSRIRADAVRGFATMGKDVKPFLNDLVRALSDREASVRRRARSAFEKLGQHARAAQPRLRSLLASASAHAAAYCHALYHAVAREDRAGELRRLLRAKPIETVRAAALTLALLRAKAAPAVPDLIQVLGSSDDRAVVHAAVALGRIGSAARDAVPVLRKLAAREAMSKSKCYDVAREARAALTKIESQ